MLPGISGFDWSVGHVIFLAIFFSVLACVITVIAVAILKAVRDFTKHKAEAICWDEEFRGLPLSARRCRHDISGRVAGRTCTNGFKCSHCAFNDEILAKETAPQDAHAFGFEMPPGRLYHRGHAWVEPQNDGTVKIGLDDLGSRLIGEPSKVELPERGSHLQINGVGWRLTKGGRSIRVLSPVAGTVIATGGPQEGWYLKVKLEDAKTGFRHLLQGEEIRSWLLQEMERIQRLLSPPAAGISLADGGVPVPDFTMAYPDADWDEIWGEVFLES
ncbi:MAG: hypothetical protein KAY24_10825 [Candidatus Eisenbacteria sp.]|nr:hypothetical protein [Candidatus Eisenbacteria bacterium]